MSKKQMNSNGRISRTSYFILFMLALLSIIAEGSNIIEDPNFEDPNTLNLYWGTGHDPVDPNAYEDIDPNGYTGNCLVMQNFSSDVQWQLAYQKLGVGAIEGGTYELYVKYKTVTSHNAMIRLLDPEWKDGEGKVWGNDMKGVGVWNTLKQIFIVPETDPCNEPIEDHNCGIYLYAEQPKDDYNPIYYDNVVLIKSTLPGTYSQIEERDDWTQYCEDSNSNPIECDANMVSYCDPNTDPNITSDSALVLCGSQTTTNTYDIILPVKTSTKYKISCSVKVKDRNNGEYSIKVIEDWGEYKRMACHLLPLHRSIGHSDQDWFYEKGYYQTRPESEFIKILIELQGFDGKLYIDELTLEEVNSHIEDKYLKIPISYEFEGMKIVKVDTNTPLSIETNAAKFQFDLTNDTIELIKKNPDTNMGSIAFEDDFLSGLANDVNQNVDGLVILDNNNITISIGADSSMLFKIEEEPCIVDPCVVITGYIAASFYNFEAGVIFVSDYQKGLIFSPIYPDLNIDGWSQYSRSPVRDVNNHIWDYTYDDDDFNSIGFKNWTGEPNFSEPNWAVTYNFESGDGFIVSIFPPKDFNNVKYAKERWRYAPLYYINYYSGDNFKYFMQKFRERANIMFVPAYTAPNMVLHGPYIPDASLDDFVDQAHSQDLEVMVYFAPAYYYTSDPCSVISDLNDLIDPCTYNVDGVYYDGLMVSKPLVTLELIRKTRNLLKDKFYTQHSSWTSTLMPYTDHIKVPFFDTYADSICLGEGVRKDLTGDPNYWHLNCPADANAWGLLYSGKNLSNTISTLIREFRPVAYDSEDHNDSLDITLMPESQIDYQLDFNGIFEVLLFGVNYESYIRELKWLQTEGEYREYVDGRYFWDTYDEMCLTYTQNDGVADVGETIYTSQYDCAPVHSDSVLTRSGNSYECDTNDSVAQWLIDDEPFYRLHFTFDDEIVTDDSDNKMNPYRFTGIDDTESEPNSETKDGRKVFYFDGDGCIAGQHDETLCFMDDSNNITAFSSFVAIKRDSNCPNDVVIFSLNMDKHFEYGIDNLQFYASVRDINDVNHTYYGGDLNDVNWHTVGIVYDQNTLTLYVDGNDVNSANDITLDSFPDFGTYSIGAHAIADEDYHHRYLIDSYDSSCGFKGYIDDLFVTDRSLTEQQILEYHQTLHKELTIDANSVRCIINQAGRKYTAARVINTTQDKGYVSIQESINEANDGDVVKVYEGIYYENIDFKGKAITVRSKVPEDWSVVEATIIDANGGYHVVEFSSGEDANSVLTGFTITGGEANGVSSLDKCGAGIYCGEASPTIRNCAIRDNSATNMGGGMTNLSSSPTLTNCTFSGNNSAHFAGGMYNCFGSSPVITNCIFTNNVADREGGGMWNYNASPTLINCIFSDNTSTTSYGGGIANNKSEPYDCLPLLINCTFSNNSAGMRGGGMYSYGENCLPVVINCIFWGNEAGFGNNEIFNYSNADPDFSYCDIEGCGGSESWDTDFGTDGGGNISGYPLFVDVNNDNYRLDRNSPCVDAGNGNTAPATDMDGQARIDIPEITNTGTGDPNYTDIGAYETDTDSPMNTTCETAKNIEVSGGDTGSTVDAADGVLWFRLEPEEDAGFTIVLCDSDFDTTITVYAGGSCGSLYEEDFNNDDPSCGDGTQSRIFDSGAGEGEIWYYKIAGNNGARGNYVFMLSEEK